MNKINKISKPERNILSIRIIILIAIIFFAFLVSGCDDAQHPAPSPPPIVRTLIVPSPAPARQVKWAGKLVPETEIPLGFRIEGRLAARSVDVGSNVRAGAVLARLDTTQSKAQAMAASATLKEAIAQEYKARREVQRVQRLIEIGTASQSRLEEAHVALASAQAQKARAEAQQAEAMNLSDFNIIKAPYDGVITAVMATPGQTLSQGQQVMQLASNKGRQILMNLPQNYSVTLSPGKKLEVYLDNGLTVKATILTISPQSDTSTQLIAVKAALDGSVIHYPLGAFLSGSVIDNSDKITTIPASALTRKGDTPAVFVVSPKSAALELREVSIKYYDQNSVALSSGLNEGEEIVTAGVSRLAAGMKVTVQDGAMK